MRWTWSYLVVLNKDLYKKSACRGVATFIVKFDVEIIIRCILVHWKKFWMRYFFRSDLEVDAVQMLSYFYRLHRDEFKTLWKICDGAFCESSWLQGTSSNYVRKKFYFTRLDFNRVLNLPILCLLILLNLLVQIFQVCF